MTKSEEKYKSLGTEEKIAENVKKIKGLFKDVNLQKRLRLYRAMTEQM